jgi:hypothetical protein
VVEIKTYFLLDCIDVLYVYSVAGGGGVDDVDGSYGGYGGYEDERNCALCYLGQALYMQLDLGLYTIRASHHKPQLTTTVDSTTGSP